LRWLGQEVVALRKVALQPVGEGLFVPLGRVEKEVGYADARGRQHDIPRDRGLGVVRDLLPHMFRAGIVIRRYASGKHWVLLNIE
jgi:hypothetical protein